MKISDSLKSMMRLEGQTAIVTGGAGHIGFAICEALAELGANLIIVDIDEEKCIACAEKITESFESKVISCVANLEKRGDIKKVIKRANDDFGGIDILVNSAALVGTSNLKGWAVDIEKQDIDIWRKAIDVNLTASFALIQKSIPFLKESKNGTIINIGSIYGFSGQKLSLYEGMDYTTPAAYAASKGGLTQLTKYLATVLAPSIRVNTISPGGIKRDQNDEFIKRYAKLTPLNRMGKEEDIKGAIAYLASNLSKYVTGQNIVVDGGISL